MDDFNSEVLLTVPEFAYLTNRNEETLRGHLRGGKLKGCLIKNTWHVFESELEKYWGALYKPRSSGKGKRKKRKK